MDEMFPCYRCGGSGKRHVPVLGAIAHCETCSGTGKLKTQTVECSSCRGIGHVGPFAVPCSKCSETGRIVAIGG